MLRSLPHLWAHRKPENAEAIRLLRRRCGSTPTTAGPRPSAAWAHGQQVT